MSILAEFGEKREKFVALYILYLQQAIFLSIKCEQAFIVKTYLKTLRFHFLKLIMKLR